ncbi:hypothetical protein GCM10022221_72720 [Actinocorallia aurea]
MTHDPYGGRPPAGYPPAYSPGGHPGGPLFAGPPAPPPRDGLATVALILAGLGAVCVSLPLSIVALIRVRRSGRSGRRLAIAGIVVSVGWIVALSLAAGLAFFVSEKTEVALTPGVCFNEAADEEALVPRTATECTKPHMYQVLSVEELPGGAYPGDRKVEQRSDALCGDRWNPALVQSPWAATHNVGYLAPARDDWDFDKTVVCLLTTVDGGSTTFLADLAAVEVDPARKRWADLAVGDCFDLPEQEVYAVTTTACDKPHDAQVVKTFSPPKGSWPGQEKVDERAEDRCHRLVTSFFEAHPPGVRTVDNYVGPTQAEWVQGDRRVLCIVESGYQDTQLHRSLVP